MRKTSGMCGGKQGLAWTLTKWVKARIHVVLVYSLDVCWVLVGSLMQVYLLLLSLYLAAYVWPSSSSWTRQQTQIPWFCWHYLSWFGSSTKSVIFPRKFLVESVELNLQPLRHPTKYWQSSIESTLPKPHQQVEGAKTPINWSSTVQVWEVGGLKIYQNLPIRNTDHLPMNPLVKRLLWIIRSLLEIKRKIGAMTRELATLEDYTWQNAEESPPIRENVLWIRKFVNESNHPR